MEDRLTWRYASTRGPDSTGARAIGSAPVSSPWRSLYTEDRHKEKDPSLLEPRVDQWRMRERVRDLLSMFEDPCFIQLFLCDKP